MSYFNQIGKITFEGQPLDNFFFAYRIPEDYYKAGAFQHYFIRNGERIERVAQKAYGDDKLYWVILIYNNIVDPYNDLPLDNEELENKALLQAQLEHGDGYTENQYAQVLEALFLENEAKREIQLPLKETLSIILDDVDAFFRRQRQQ